MLPVNMLTVIVQKNVESRQYILFVLIRTHTNTDTCTSILVRLR